MANSRSKRPELLRERTEAWLRPLLPPEGKALRLRVAYSGGLDSSVLLHVLVKLTAVLPLEIQACHIHHGLSDHADTWSTHCHQICASLDVPLKQISVKVSQNAAEGLEAAARQARYQALYSDWNDWLVLGHHADDQAETLLFRLCRGAGVTGAACMRGIDRSRRLLRPLLTESRACLESYARAEGLAWVEDDSNPDLRFSRNYLRHNVVAPLRARFPAAVDKLASSAALFDESDKLLSELANEDSCRIQPGVLGSRERFRALTRSRARNLLRFWWRDAALMLPDTARLDDGLRQILTSTAARCVFGRIAVCVYRDLVWMEPAVLETPQALIWQGETELPWGGGVLRFPAGMIFSGQPLRVDIRRHGMHWSLGATRPRRAFKLLCQDAGVPPWWRDLLPCLWCGDELLWVGGLDELDIDAAAVMTPVWGGGWRFFQKCSQAELNASPCGS